MSIFGPPTPVDTQDGLRVLKAGDTMTGDLAMGGNLVRGLPTTYPPLYFGNEAISWAQAVELGVDMVSKISDPIRPQNAATKNYVDGRTSRVHVVARVGVGSDDYQNVDIAQMHTTIGGIFRHAYGDAAAWNSTTGSFTAPAAGVYSVAVNLRIQSPSGTGSLENVYTSVNGSTAYWSDTNLVYRFYGRTNNKSSWHSFQLAGLVALSQGDTLGLNSSYGSGTWTFHTSASMTIARISI